MSNLFSSVLSVLLAASYVYVAYSTESVDFFFTHAFSIGAFCACSLSLFFNYAKYFPAIAQRDFVSFTLMYIMVFAGLVFTATTAMGIGASRQVWVHCAAFAPIGIALLSAKINASTVQKYEILFIILLCISAVIPYLIILVLCMFHLTSKAGSEAPGASPFLTKADPFTALVCNVFFTMSILHGFFISLATIHQPELAYGISTPAYYGAYHIVPFSFALIVLFYTRNTLKFIGLAFYLIAAPSAIIPYYVIFPLALIAVLCCPKVCSSIDVR
ncbi:MAG: hypothetical protein DELT_00401 [Desulfovibrio sp.]